jgi:hypothetical protein
MRDMAKEATGRDRRQRLSLDWSGKSGAPQRSADIGLRSGRAYPASPVTNNGLHEFAPLLAFSVAAS